MKHFELMSNCLQSEVTFTALDTIIEFIYNEISSFFMQDFWLAFLLIWEKMLQSVKQQQIVFN